MIITLKSGTQYYATKVIRVAEYIYLYEYSYVTFQDMYVTNFHFDQVESIAIRQ